MINTIQVNATDHPVHDFRFLGIYKDTEIATVGTTYNNLNVAVSFTPSDVWEHIGHGEPVMVGVQFSSSGIGYIILENITLTKTGSTSLTIPVNDDGNLWQSGLKFYNDNVIVFFFLTGTNASNGEWHLVNQNIYADQCHYLLPKAGGGNYVGGYESIQTELDLRKAPVLYDNDNDIYAYYAHTKMNGNEIIAYRFFGIDVGYTQYRYEVDPSDGSYSRAAIYPSIINANTDNMNSSDKHYVLSTTITTQAISPKRNTDLYGQNSKLYFNDQRLVPIEVFTPTYTLSNPTATGTAMSMANWYKMGPFVDGQFKLTASWPTVSGAQTPQIKINGAPWANATNKTVPVGRAWINLGSKNYYVDLVAVAGGTASSPYITVASSSPFTQTAATTNYKIDAQIHYIDPTWTL